MKWRTCVVLLCVTAVLADDELWEVQTAQGPVRGYKDPKTDVFAFYNIPYATAPTGDNKFKAPLPPPNWTAPFEAINDKTVICPQNEFLLFKWSELKPEADNVDMKEDCLVANLFVPITNERNLSVLVYVHGGGFVTGFGDLFRGTQIINKKKDFIMVTFNYRLGAHGFLCLGTEDVPGNAGMKDQVALLHWVQQNIASFGGNPNDVTIGGCSAGSCSVDLLMLSKSAEGLFHRVIPESGANLAVLSIQRDPIEVAKMYARELNELAIIDNIDDLEQFYKKTVLEVLNSGNFINRTDSTFVFSPCVERDTDGAFLTESPLTILKKRNYKNLPVLYGFADKEGLLRILLFEDWKNMMNEKFSDFLPADLEFDSDAEREEVANKVKKFYFGNNSVSNDTFEDFVDFFSDVLVNHAMLWAAKLYAQAGNNQVYLYEYSYVDKNLIVHPDVQGAEHCAQAFAWLDNRDRTDESLDTPEYQKTRQIVRDIWHNFIKTGKPVPDNSSLPEWPPAEVTRSPHMVLDKEVKLEGVLLEKRTRLWEEIYEKHYRDAVPPRSGAGSMAAKNIFTFFVFYIVFCLGIIV